MEPVSISKQEYAYDVVTQKGNLVEDIEGSVSIIGDFVRIGANIFYRPDYVKRVL